MEATRGEYTVVIGGTDVDDKNNIFETSEEQTE